jgi:hypothetical protein
MDEFQDLWRDNSDPRGKRPQQGNPAPQATAPAVDPAIMQMFHDELEKRQKDLEAKHQAELDQLRQQFQIELQQQRMQAEQPSAPVDHQPPASRKTGHLDYVKKQQLKAISISSFEGKLDLKLVTEFLEKVKLLGQAIDLRPTLSTDDSNSMIELAVGWFASEPMIWFKVVVLEADYSTSYEVARQDGYPFTFDRFCEIMIHRFSPTGALERLWWELSTMKRQSYTEVHTFHRAFLDVAKMLNVYRETEEKGGRAYAIYLAKLTNQEEMIYQAMLASIQRPLFLDDVMTLVENVETGHRTSSTNPNMNLHTTTTKGATIQESSAAAGSSGTTPMELDVINTRRGRGGRRGGRGFRGQRTDGNFREKCYKCEGYGHHSYDCPTADDYRKGEGIQRRGNQNIPSGSCSSHRGGMGFRGRGGS